jgi:hypothetical protein
MSNYYYLVAGLPDLLQGATKKGLSYETVIEEIENELSIEDSKLLHSLRLRYDCENLISILEERDLFDIRGNFSKSVLQNEINSCEKLPLFMVNFLESHKEGKDLLPEAGKLEQLLHGYYSGLIAGDNSFMREFAELELDIGNVVAAKSAQLLNLTVEKSVVPANETADKISKSSSPDFGLGGHFSWLDTILSNFNDPKALELAVDKVRWEQVEEISEQYYFSIEAVLAFVIKLNSVERWMRLDEKEGLAQMEKLLSNMASAVTLA